MLRHVYIYIGRRSVHVRLIYLVSSREVFNTVQSSSLQIHIHVQLEL